MQIRSFVLKLLVLKIIAQGRELPRGLHPLLLASLRAKILDALSEDQCGATWSQTICSRDTVSKKNKKADGRHRLHGRPWSFGAELNDWG